MSKKDQKKKDQSQIEEVDLSNLSPDGLFDLGKLVRDAVKEKKNATAEQEVHTEDEEHHESHDDEILDPVEITEPGVEDLLLLEEEDDFIAFDDDFDDLDLEEDEEGEDEDGQPRKKKERGLKKVPIDRSQDRRRVGKGLQKFIDVTVPPELLEGLTENMQLLLKKGKVE